ncbi:pyruvate oxidase [Enterococcus diestrammenae]|uniref:Pyruvate oxidase n=1 Tax=Enterococcus diestrammenae TaxID=1155073 RepID=A0ABV0F3L4_9ENTE|nr:pyruvate oxidase [Enterococcus diestrammenae]KAF1296718.1 pyruvate oxidase [Enterococcus diestrammenae]
MSTIHAGVAMLKVMEAWGIDHIYGIPGGSFNSTMDALYKEQEHIQYIQVRHEEAGALAAAADAKLTGKIGAVFGSAGPGATHLINGLYDAQMDHVPVLALLGQVATTSMNYHAFQELNENPLFADVSVYNRTVMTAESLPHVVEEAIKSAYQHSGVAVVTIPVDLGFAEIADNYQTTAEMRQTSLPQLDETQLQKALPLIKAAQRPILFIGQGLRGHFAEIKAFSEHFSMPIINAVLAKGIVPDRYENYLGSSARVATKPANEAAASADLVVYVGTDMPFTQNVVNPEAKFIQIDIDASKFGRRHKVDVAILGDGGEALQRLVALGEPRPKDDWLTANQENIKNWHAWRHSFDTFDEGIGLRPEPVYAEVNRIAKEDALFVVDVGNVTTHSVRHLELNGQQAFTTSGWFATMGYGVPGGIAAQLSFPQKQVFTFSGDGGYAMNLSDIITQVKYHLPIINVVLTNDSFGFIQAEQETTNTALFGVDLADADFGKASEALGAQGFTVRTIAELRPAFEAAAKTVDRPVVIEVKIKNEDPLPVEALQLDPAKFTAAEISAFSERYHVHDMPTLSELLAKK